MGGSAGWTAARSRSAPEPASAPLAMTSGLPLVVCSTRSPGKWVSGKIQNSGLGPESTHTSAYVLCAIDTFLLFQKWRHAGMFKACMQPFTLLQYLLWVLCTLACAGGALHPSGCHLFIESNRHLQWLLSGAVNTLPCCHHVLINTHDD
jgi:hypothetical protein